MDTLAEARHRTSPKAVVRRFSEEIVNKGNFELLAELVHPDVDFASTAAGVAPGIEGVKDVFGRLRQGFPTLACAVEELVAEGDVVAERFTMTGRHEGDFHGIKPTGKQVTMTGMAMFRVVDGKIAARWGVEDHLGLMRQLGALDR